MPWIIADGYDFVSGLRREEAYDDDKFYLGFAKKRDVAILVGFK